ncbi:MAG: hypothetical protein ACOYYS_20455 [Chloroflexota bacterium]
MKKHGELTARIAKKLFAELESRGYDVLYDHGATNDGNVGKIVSWFGSKYQRGAELSQLDIAIVEKNSGKIFALIEIEETTDNPKKILSDVLGTLLGEHIRFAGNRELTIDSNTMLIILGQSKKRHQERNQYIQAQAMKVKSSSATASSKLKTVFVDSFADEDELAKLLPSVLDRAFRGEL